MKKRNRNRNARRARQHAPQPRQTDNRIVRKAIELHPEREERLRAFAAYHKTLPATVATANAQKRCFAEDGSLLFEAFLTLRAEDA